MKALRNTLTDPTAIAISVGHWLLLLFAMFVEEHSQPFHFAYEPLLTQILLLLNLPAWILTTLIGIPTAAFINTAERTEAFLFLVAGIFVTLQWLFIGKVISAFVNLVKQEKKFLP